MAAKLDRSRAFATVVGIVDDELTGACFYQDGKHFTASGDELNPEPEVAVPEVVVKTAEVKLPEKQKAKSKDTSDLDLL